MRRRFNVFPRTSQSLRKNSTRRLLRIESLERRVVKDAGMAGAVWDLHGSFDAGADADAVYLGHIFDANGELSLNDAGDASSFVPSRRPVFGASAAGAENELDAAPADADPNALADLPELPAGDPDQAGLAAPDLGDVDAHPPLLPAGDWNVDDLAAMDNELDWVALNPQPLPPRVFDVQDGLFDDLDLVSLNPQPLPPRVWDVDQVGDSLADELARIGLNPQPLPPRELMADSAFSALDWAMLNPQPLPPRVFDEALFDESLFEEGPAFDLSGANELAYLEPETDARLFDVEIQSQLSTATEADNLANSLARHLWSTSDSAIHRIF